MNLSPVNKKYKYFTQDVMMLLTICKCFYILQPIVNNEIYIMRFFNYLVLAGVLGLSACSVHKAASNEGVSVSDVRKCKMRVCFLSHGMEIVDRHQEVGGKYIETYRGISRKTGLNYARAAGHGVMDVATLGLWEIVGTPVEGAISNNPGYVTAKASYASKESEDVETLDIYDAFGKKVLK